MKKTITLLLFMVFSTSYLTAQDIDSPCGTTSGRSQWLKEYQNQPDAFTKGGDTTLYIAMSIHLVGNDAGAGYFSVKSLLQAFCKLNELYLGTGIQFYQTGDIHYIANSAYYQHETILEGAEMMFEHNIANTLNCYFVSDPAGNCGYNLPYAGIANAKSCSGPNDITWAHEVGHALSLPHPFLGWEGGVEWDGSIDHDFSDPAPETATIDYTYFLDTLIMDTLIIDTVFVEKMDGSNCTFAADGFCDTSPDYLASRWTCNSEGISGVIQHDPNNIPFQSDGSLIMGYANDVCQTRFTQQQQQAMRASVIANHPEWIMPVDLLLPIEEPPVTIMPLDGEDVISTAAELSWQAVENATHYLVYVSRLASFPGGLTSEFLTTETSVLTEELLNGKTYHWKILAFNRQHLCATFSDIKSFTILHPQTSVNNIEGLTTINIFPQPLRQTQVLNIVMEMENSWNGQLHIKNQLGQVIHTEEIQLYPGANKYEWQLSHLSKGIYWLNISNGKEGAVKKMIVL